MREIPFVEYREWFSFAELDRDDHGILVVRFHRDGHSLDNWDMGPIRDLTQLFAAIGADLENRVVILTGTGDWLFRSTPSNVDGNIPVPTSGWDVASASTRRLCRNLLNIEVPVIGAINGSADVHAELLMLSDYVLAVESAMISDDSHFTLGVVPGDGVVSAWMRILGPNRGRQFLLSGMKLSADDLRAAGAVAEVVSADELLPRALAVARTMAAKPTQTLRYTRILFTREFRRLMEYDQPFGLALEGLAGAEYWPAGEAAKAMS